MSQKRTYRIQEVARASGISVRALHHYDEIGLLSPKSRSRAGYRLYHEDDLLRLQQILLGRELGLSLEEIRRSLDDARFNHKETLLRQKEALEKKAKQTADMIRAVENALRLLDAKTDGKEGKEEFDMKELFQGFDPAQYEEEAKERWGHTDAYQISAKRTKAYTKDDWKNIQDEQGAIYKDAFAAFKAGKKPSDPEVRAIVERHRLSIDRWFYPCSKEMHGCLADMYEADTRFADNIDKFGEGLTTFLVAAIRESARH